VSRRRCRCSIIWSSVTIGVVALLAPASAVAAKQTVKPAKAHVRVARHAARGATPTSRVDRATFFWRAVRDALSICNRGCGSHQRSAPAPAPAPSEPAPTTSDSSASADAAAATTAVADTSKSGGGNGNGNGNGGVGNGNGNGNKVPPPPPPPAPAPTPSDVFRGDWDAGSWQPWTNLQYNQSAQESDQFVTVTSPLREGTYAARFTVRPGDKFLTTSGERCEVEYDGADETDGSDYWYAWSTMFPTDWSTSDWAIFMQWHSHFPIVPPMAFVVGQDYGVLNLNTGTLDANGQGSYHPSFTVLRTLNKGKWNDFVVHVHWSSTANGSITVWHRVAGGTFTKVVDVSGVPTLQQQNGVVSGNYMKHGLYRSQNNATMTSVLYLDGFRRGTSLAEMDGAFGADPLGL
jgi:hypothetical protein